MCHKGVQKEYNSKHKWVVKVIHWDLCLELNSSVYILENEALKNLLDFKIKTITSSQPEDRHDLKKKILISLRRSSISPIKGKQKEKKKKRTNTTWLIPEPWLRAENF